MFEMDESEYSDDPQRKDPFNDTVKFVSYNYADIMQRGSDELKNVVNIILGGEPPAVYKKGESA
jgi:hypothetical protein